MAISSHASSPRQPPRPPSALCPDPLAPDPSRQRVTHVCPHVPGSSQVTFVFKACHACPSWGRAAVSAQTWAPLTPAGSLGVSVWALAGSWLSSMATVTLGGRPFVSRKGLWCSAVTKLMEAPVPGNGQESVLAWCCPCLLVGKGETVRGVCPLRKKTNTKSAHSEHRDTHTLEREQGLLDGPLASEWVACHSWAGFPRGMREHGEAFPTGVGVTHPSTGPKGWALARTGPSPESDAPSRRMNVHL